jgi:hypothetical protein
MSHDRTDRSHDIPASDETTALRELHGGGDDMRGRATVAAPEPLPDDLDAPDGIESLGQASRDMADPADQRIDDLPLDAEDVKPPV